MFLCVRWSDAATDLSHIAASFDQETGAAVMARIAVQRYMYITVLVYYNNCTYSLCVDLRMMMDLMC